MTALWFTDAPGFPETRDSFDTIQTSTWSDSSSVWATQTEPIHPKQLDRAYPYDFAVGPSGVLHTLVYRLDQANLPIPAKLRSDILERNEPVDADVAAGQLGYLSIDGQLTLAYRQTWEDVQTLSAVWNNRWLVVYCDASVDPKLTMLID